MKRGAVVLHRASIGISSLAFLVITASCQGPKTLEEAVKPRSSLKSFHMTGSGQTASEFVKLVEGKPMKRKMEGSAGFWMIVDLAENVVYMSPANGQTYVSKTSLPPGGKLDDINDVDLFDGQSPVVGTDEVNGMKCVRVDVKDRDGKPGTIWISIQYGLVCKYETRGSVTFTYDQLNAVPDSEFELPAGAKVRDGRPMIDSQ
jgi:hypothetical protein